MAQLRGLEGRRGLAALHASDPDWKINQGKSTLNLARSGLCASSALHTGSKTTIIWPVINRDRAWLLTGHTENC